MSLLAVTVGVDPSAVVDAVRAVGWYGVWRSLRWRLANYCVAAARERCYAGSACELV